MYYSYLTNHKRKNTPKKTQAMINRDQLQISNWSAINSNNCCYCFRYVTKDFCPIFNREVNIEKCRHKTFWNSAEWHGTPLSPPPSMAGPLLRKKLVYFLFEKYLIIAQVSLCVWASRFNIKYDLGFRSDLPRV